MSGAALPSGVVRKLLRDLMHLSDNPPEGIHVVIDEDNITDVQAWILGPEGTPFEAGAFRIRLVLPPDFPTSPPRGYFLTKIFHPNVGPGGEICVNTLKREWKRETGMREVFVTIKCLLIAPNPESALNEEAGKLLLADYAAYASRARTMAEVYARGNRKEVLAKMGSGDGAGGTAAGAADVGGIKEVQQQGGGQSPSVQHGSRKGKDAVQDQRVSPSHGQAQAHERVPLGPGDVAGSSRQILAGAVGEGRRDKAASCLSPGVALAAVSGSAGAVSCLGTGVGSVSDDPREQLEDAPSPPRVPERARTPASSNSRKRGGSHVPTPPAKKKALGQHVGVAVGDCRVVVGSALSRLKDGRAALRRF
ncbi:UBC-like protein [Gonapodya prolifera JEL478]|uniref:E2 ubiquitin-conjugating enzyme n=1 Tax=Gonapodya prolifera (strain JEL478) TaxID=1344416 RepID=A0A139ARF3_GONPJ|nr:UBC-like protein [Gonapodya prolifera JEL478]|eukprot:KXS19331.1 UBC-like protein [Gonapodya prolifera JEL478]